MPDLLKILKKSKEKKFLKKMETDPTLQEVKKVADIVVAGIIPQVIDNITSIVTEQVMEMRKTIKDGESIKGDKGDSIIGVTGKSGASGKDGLDGVPGKDGIIGKDGKNGINGKNGIDGVDGRQGEKGYTGNDGSPDEPQEIADKLNTLKEKVDVKVIKGLSKLLQDIKRVAKGGGGGMGNPLHEETALTPATTTVNLTSSVAASGYAIWVYYNGQAVSRNDASGYTISGRTITLGFTPSNGTYLDVIYIRS